MNIFKNLSNQEKKKVINQCKKINYQATEHVATDIHWLVWDKDATDEYCKANSYPIISKIVSGCENWNLIENPYKKEDCLQAVKIAKLRRLDDRANPIQIGESVYNAEMVALGYSFMDAKKKITFREKPIKINENGEKYSSCLYITDGDLNFMVMPLRTTPENAIKPDSITAADVEKARKYKVYLDGKSRSLNVYRATGKNIIINRSSDSRTSYFVVIPQDAFFKKVFRVPEDWREIEDFSSIELEKSENITKHTEDLFHKQVVEGVETVKKDKYFWHFYENGTGVCFKAE